MDTKIQHMCFVKSTMLSSKMFHVLGHCCHAIQNDHNVTGKQDKVLILLQSNWPILYNSVVNFEKYVTVRQGYLHCHY